MRQPPEHYRPQTRIDKRPQQMWLLLTVGSLLFLTTLVAAPLALASGHAFLGLTIYRAFSRICHQLPERSFFIAGYQFAVCARCFGIYAGFAAATVCYPLVRSLRSSTTPSRKWLVLAAAPLAMDVALNYLGVVRNTHGSRVLTGSLLGSAAVFYVMPALIELLQTLFNIPAKPAAQKLKLPPEQVAAAQSDYSAPYRRI